MHPRGRRAAGGDSRGSGPAPGFQPIEPRVAVHHSRVCPGDPSVSPCPMGELWLSSPSTGGTQKKLRAEREVSEDGDGKVVPRGLFHAGT